MALFALALIGLITLQYVKEVVPCISNSAAVLKNGYVCALVELLRSFEKCVCLYDFTPIDLNTLRCVKESGPYN